MNSKDRLKSLPGQELDIVEEDNLMTRLYPDAADIIPGQRVMIKVYSGPG